MKTTVRTRLMGAVTGAALAAGVLTATAAPASAAAIKCAADDRYTGCLTIEYAGDQRWDVLVGFDRYLPEAYAREIIACPGAGRLTAKIMGSDPSNSDDDLGLAYLKSGWPKAGPRGLSAEFSRSSMNLNEDSGEADEVYAEISYYDCHTGLTQSFKTGLHKGKF
ncbi:hypothetical protein [Actinoplanes sp. NPDC051859]|uniref:hypothetical protein n=1 Tax=Actinoplanes sp. NPDC051859 TaxID=3363909 RepID=UPI00379DB587